MDRHAFRVSVAADSREYLVYDSLPAWVAEQAAPDGVENDGFEETDDGFAAVWEFSGEADRDELVERMTYRLEKYAPWWRVEYHECDGSGHEDCAWTEVATE